MNEVIEHPVESICNGLTRQCFNALARKAVKYMDPEFAYFSDIMWDAVQFAAMNKDEMLLVMVTESGTHSARDLASLRDLMLSSSKPKAILRCKIIGRYDSVPSVVEIETF